MIALGYTIQRYAALGGDMAVSRIRRYEALLSLAFFFFAFLEASSFYSLALSQTDFSLGLATQIPSLTASAFGFLSFPFIMKRTTRHMRRILAGAGIIIGSVSLVGTLVITNPVSIEIFKVASFYLLGCVGAGIHSSTSKLFAQSSHLALAVGVSHAIGLSLQFITYLFVPFGVFKALFIALATMCMVVFAYRAWQITQPLRPEEIRTRLAEEHPSSQHPTMRLRHQNGEQTSAQPKKLALYLVVLIALFALLFNSLYGVSSLSSQSYSPFILLHPRLILALSGIGAGVLFDYKLGRYAGLIMITMAFLAAASILGIEAGLSPALGQTVFFLADGFFIVFYTASFLSLAPQMDNPNLWAGMGRTVANFCAIPTTIPAIVFFESGNVLAIIVLIFPLFAIILFFLVKAGLLNFYTVHTNGGYILGPAKDFKQAASDTSAAHSDAPPLHVPKTNSPNSLTKEAAYEAGLNSGTHLPVLTQEEKLQLFAAHYELTARETEILAAVTADEQPLKHTANELGISLRTVQHHLTSIYKKTNTQTRAGLTRRFIENDLQSKE